MESDGTSSRKAARTCDISKSTLKINILEILKSIHME